MCSVQSATVASFGVYSSEQLEDEFITSLFSGSTTCSDHDYAQTTPVHAKTAYQNGVQSDSTCFLANQMDHDYYAQTKPLTMQIPIWEEPATTKSSASSLNMSTYFSTFDPTVQCQSNQQRTPVFQNKQIIQQAMGKMHRAHINLVPNATGNFKAIVKRKRKRTVFRTDQVEAMEEVFAKKPYVTKEDRKAIVERLQISDKSVKVWFQNRRLKNKRGDDISEDENRNSPNLDRLDYVESKIHESTNEFGYVTLDDRIMSDLVKVIDDYLYSSNTDIMTKDIEMEEIKVKMETVPVYEPISPASTSDNSNEETLWECQSSVGNEYLQRLIDIDSIISN